MNGLYRSAIWKLTAWYLLLVMFISLAFSAVVYHFATDTLAQTLTTQQARIYKEFPVFSGNPFFVRDKDAEQGAHTILLNLLYFNVLVLVGAGLASYWLAQRTLKPIEVSNERQKRFVADASHELRTPLTAIKMSTEVALMDKTVSVDGLRAALQSNLEETDKLSSLLNDLLRLSQLESNDVQHSFTPIAASAITQEAIEKTRPRATSHGVVIKDKTREDMVYGDRPSLVQLVTILLDNAIKYSHKGSVVTISSQQSAGGTLLTITDQGIGIEREALTHVFDRFYRADKARSGTEGYGLGLSIAKQIADIHHGAITISSKAGSGTTVQVALPSSDGHVA